MGLIDDIIEAQERNESKLVDRCWERIEELEDALGAMVTEYCDRDGLEEDMPLPPGLQSCEYVGKALEILNS
jgi:hypothetical protein